MNYISPEILMENAIKNKYYKRPNDIYPPTENDFDTSIHKFVSDKSNLQNQRLNEMTEDEVSMGTRYYDENVQRNVQRMGISQEGEAEKLKKMSDGDSTRSTGPSRSADLGATSDLGSASKSNLVSQKTGLQSSLIHNKPMPETFYIPQQSGIKFSPLNFHEAFDSMKNIHLELPQYLDTKLIIIIIMLMIIIYLFCKVESLSTINKLYEKNLIKTIN